MPRWLRCTWRGIFNRGQKLYEPPGTLLPGPEIVDLRTIKRIFIFGVGKGINRAPKPLRIGYRATGGHVIDKHGTPHNLKRVGLTYWRTPHSR